MFGTNWAAHWPALSRIFHESITLGLVTLFRPPPPEFPNRTRGLIGLDIWGAIYGGMGVFSSSSRGVGQTIILFKKVSHFAMWLL